MEKRTAGWRVWRAEDGGDEIGELVNVLHTVAIKTEEGKVLITIELDHPLIGEVDEAAIVLGTAALLEDVARMLAEKSGSADMIEVRLSDVVMEEVEESSDEAYDRLGEEEEGDDR